MFLEYSVESMVYDLSIGSHYVKESRYIIVGYNVYKATTTHLFQRSSIVDKNVLTASYQRSHTTQRLFLA